MIQVEAFLRYLQIERRLSPVTITNYRRQLTVVVEMLNEMNVSEWRQLDATKARNVAAKVVVKAYKLPVWHYVYRHCGVSVIGWCNKISFLQIQ